MYILQVTLYMMNFLRYLKKLIFYKIYTLFIETLFTINKTN